MRGAYKKGKLSNNLIHVLMERCRWIAEFKERAFSSPNSEDSILNGGLVDIHIIK